MPRQVSHRFRAQRNSGQSGTQGLRPLGARSNQQTSLVFAKAYISDMDRPSRRRGPYSKTDRRRQDIIRAAMEVFAERGYQAASVRQIAVRVGMSETGVLHHFGGKTELLAAVLDAREHQDFDRLQDGEGAIPVRRLPDLMRRNSLHRSVIQLFTHLAGASTTPDDPAHRFFADRYARLRGSLAEQIRRSQDAGEIRRDLDAAAAAQLLLAVMDGLQVQWLYDENVDMVGPLDTLITSWLET